MKSFAFIIFCKAIVYYCALLHKFVLDIIPWSVWDGSFMTGTHAATKVNLMLLSIKYKCIQIVRLYKNLSFIILIPTILTLRLKSKILFYVKCGSYSTLNCGSNTQPFNRTKATLPPYSTLPLPSTLPLARYPLLPFSLPKAFLGVADT